MAQSPPAWQSGATAASESRPAPAANVTRARPGRRRARTVGPVGHGLGQAAAARTQKAAVGPAALPERAGGPGR